MNSPDNQIIQFRITDVKQETPAARTYTLEKLDDTQNLSFSPGQFLTFIIKPGKQEIRRSYSILTLPGEPLKVTVKKVTNGIISRYILQHWRKGDAVTSLYPAGRFTLQPQHSFERDIFCFAAGSGIVPVLPQIRHLLQHEPQSRIHLIYSNHNEADTLFQEEIRQLDATCPQLQVIYFFSEPSSPLHQRRRLSNLATEDLIKQLLTYRKEDAAFLLCGPFEYMRMLMFTIRLMHFNKENIRRENFIAETRQRTAYVLPPKFPAARVSVNLFGKIHHIQVNSEETILAAALRQGLQPPYSCQNGVCGTCVARCVTGKVYMSNNEVLLDSEVDNGLVLTCTGYPVTQDTSVLF